MHVSSGRRAEMGVSGERLLQQPALRLTKNRNGGWQKAMKAE